MKVNGVNVDTYTQHYNGVAGPLYNAAVGIQDYSDKADPPKNWLRDKDIPGCPGSIGERQGSSVLGIFFPNSNVKIGTVSDGTSHTLAIGERHMGDTNYLAGLSQACAWPCDTAGFKSIKFGLNECVDLGTEFTSTCPGEYGGNVRPFTSNHPGVVCFAFADGSATALAEDTNLAVLQALATRKFGEANVNYD